MKPRLLFILLLGFALNSGLLQCQQLSIQTETGKQTVLTRSDIEALPHTNVVTGAAETSATFTGVSLRAVLEKAGVSLGESLRGKRLASCLLVEAADGYRVVFALPEIDSAFNEKQIVLAFLRNGKPLDEKEGPYRIVVPDEKRMARWIRQVTTLKIVDVN
ncbi:MAG TPA: molybdopterin-dependent oxidoreductase [Candidatus Eremiobacteraceae bacterium]|nr:molybdopterin-dependent oxidoreductase [Candidatus Eremiobacteraceae bacterium]